MENISNNYQMFFPASCSPNHSLSDGCGGLDDLHHQVIDHHGSTSDQANNKVMVQQQQHVHDHHDFIINGAGESGGGGGEDDQAMMMMMMSSSDEKCLGRSSSSSENNNNNNNKVMAAGKKVRKPRYAFQTRSQVDILDDGYRWRKYGQKAVKNNKFPRSYYRCTHEGCNVKKQVQRLTKDENVVVTTYEGMHTHPIDKPTDNFDHILTQMQFFTTTTTPY